MTRDITTSLQHDLQQFVLQTQNRLEGLLKALNHLREAAKESAQASVPLAGAACLGAANGSANEQSEFEATEILQTPLRPATAAEDSEDTQRDATKYAWPAADDASDATDRLAAIKRRLAEQIKNP